MTYQDERAQHRRHQQRNRQIRSIRSQRTDRRQRSSASPDAIIKADLEGPSLEQHDATCFVRYRLPRSYLNCKGSISGQVYERLRRSELSTIFKSTRIAASSSLSLLLDAGEGNWKYLRSVFFFSVLQFCCVVSIRETGTTYFSQVKSATKKTNIFISYENCCLKNGVRT